MDKRVWSPSNVAYVLGRGAWLGAGVATRRPSFEGIRHEAYPVTLTGLGERSHLSKPEVIWRRYNGLGQHHRIRDLHDVLLVGQQLRGIVVTGGRSGPERLARLVYVDSGPAPTGLFPRHSTARGQGAHRRQVAESGDGWLLPVPSWEELENVYGASLEGLGDEERRLMRSRALSAFGTYTQP